MPIRVLVNGAEGKMGHEIVKTIQQDKAFELVGATDKNDDLAKAIQKSKTQIVIDFTASSVAFQNASIIIAAGVHPVIGTTGFLPEQIEELSKRCARQKLGAVIAPNFSIAAVLAMQFTQQVAKYFPHAEVIEMHHNTKEDSPSGTALRTAELIAAARLGTPLVKKSRETVPGARGANHQEVPIHAIRLPGLVAHLMVIFGGRGEVLSIKHDSLHRESFMPGIKLACNKVLEHQELVYGLEHLL
jgi:4-hydroxy-tetrahydrodipicolinate reductase